MKNFIMVSDGAIIKKMKNAGFKLFKENKDFCIFINAPEKLEFCHIDKTKIFETNRLNF